MYEVMVQAHFSAAHRLRDYKGKCENLHGHNWKVEAVVGSTRLNDIGMVVDFKEARERLNQVIRDLDHTNLNELPYFKEVNPTSENIAKYLYSKLSDLIKKEGLKVKRVLVWETDSSCASYFENMGS